MPGPRPFRGLRYTREASDLGALLAPPSTHLTPAERERYVARDPHNAMLVASPEGHGDDRSKFVRYARAAARLAEWRRESILGLEERPAFYRLTQWIGTDRIPRTTLFAVAALPGLIPVETDDSKLKEERLRLLEATRTSFEPAIAFYEDPGGERMAALRSAPASAEGSSEMDGAKGTFETIDEPNAVARLAEVFRDTTLYVADNVEAVAAAREFDAPGVLVALASLDDASYARLPVHRVVRRLPEGLDATLSKLAMLFQIEDHHSRNLAIYLDQAAKEGRTAFGMATEGGLGYLLVPSSPIGELAAAWFSRDVLGRLLGVGESEPILTFTDAVQAIRATNEGASAAFLMPTPGRHEILEAHAKGLRLPSRSVQTYPAVPTGLVFWSLGDEA